MKLMICLALILTFPCGLLANEDLALYAFISKTTDGKASLSLRVTNKGDQERTVLTGRGTITVAQFPLAIIRYDIMTMGPKENPEEWKFVPSLAALAPVTLRKGETATLAMELSGKEWLSEDATGKIMVKIEYTIGKKLAERHSLWSGTLEVQESLKSLRSK